MDIKASISEDNGIAALTNDDLQVLSEDSFHLGIKALIRNDEGSVLLLRVNPAKLNGEHRDYWDLPGGRVQKGDDVIDTLKREVAEETGITDLKSTKEVGMVLANIRIPVGD